MYLLFKAVIWYALPVMEQGIIYQYYICGVYVHELKYCLWALRLVATIFNNKEQFLIQKNVKLYLADILLFCQNSFLWSFPRRKSWILKWHLLFVEYMLLYFNIARKPKTLNTTVQNLNVWYMAMWRQT